MDALPPKRGGERDQLVSGFQECLDLALPRYCDPRGKVDRDSTLAGSEDGKPGKQPVLDPGLDQHEQRGHPG